LPEDVLHGLFDLGTTLMAVTPGYAPIGLAALARAVEDLREATRTADKAKLAALTASEPSYDHSDTRVQKQTEFINGAVNRKMIIKSLEVRGSHRTPRWRKTDSNSRSLREGKGYGQHIPGKHCRLGLNL